VYTQRQTVGLCPVPYILSVAVHSEMMYVATALLVTPSGGELEEDEEAEVAGYSSERRAGLVWGDPLCAG
jgi:hypothetical protein